MRIAFAGTPEFAVTAQCTHPHLGMALHLVVNGGHRQTTLFAFLLAF